MGRSRIALRLAAEQGPGLSLERDFGRLQGRELARALADIGLTRNDLSSLLKGCPIARQMFPRMMERIGVDTERACGQIIESNDSWLYHWYNFGSNL